VLLSVHHVRAELRPQQPGVRGAGAGPCRSPAAAPRTRRPRAPPRPLRARATSRRRSRPGRRRTARHREPGRYGPERGDHRTRWASARPSTCASSDAPKAARTPGAARTAPRSMPAMRANACGLRTENGVVEQAGRIEIGDERSNACEKSSILDASHTRAGQPRRHPRGPPRTRIVSRRSRDDTRLPELQQLIGWSLRESDLEIEIVRSCGPPRPFDRDPSGHDGDGRDRPGRRIGSQGCRGRRRRRTRTFPPSLPTNRVTVARRARDHPDDGPFSVAAPMEP